ncbi:hypothetical protein [Legionella spiritensis]|uniref:hypothetical protein n=1 Tax=Legionella spiritensis TaxID=452 RepID=UPI000F6BEC8B|nr:hypothetical protein [Legionella spiritensis]VEG90041.1 Uncharacterized protein conserved in bacteria [Legionella spiritensis]
MNVVINGEISHAPRGSEPLTGQGDYFLNILLALGYDPDYPPLGAWLGKYKALEGKWIIATPVHWEATHNDAMLLNTGKECGLDDKLSRIWFAEVSQFLAQDGFSLVYVDSETWLLGVDGKPDIHSRAVKHVLHQSLMPALEAMDASMYWQRLFTELQMFLASHPLNSNPALAASVNGLWFWGGGDLSEEPPQSLVTDDQVIRRIFPGSLPVNPLPGVDREALWILHENNTTLIDTLAKTARKYQVHWYWNNIACRTYPRRWWSRLWRR